LPMAGKIASGMVVTAISSPSGITLTPEYSYDGTSWSACDFELATSNFVATIPNASLAVGLMASLYCENAPRWVRVRASAWTSGSVTVTVVGADAFHLDVPWTGSLANTNQPPGVLQAGGWSTTAAPTYTTATLEPLSLDTAGSMRVVDKATAATAATAPANAAQAGMTVLSTIPALTTGNLSALTGDLQGRLMVRTNSQNPFVCRVSGQTTMVNATCTPALPGGASVFHYVTSVVMSNGPTAQTLKVLASTTTACGGSPTDVTSTVYLGVNSGAAMTFADPIKIGQANSYLCCQGSGNTAASCTITGYLAP